MPLDGSEFKFEIDETTKLLIAARERIERGWCQGSMRQRGAVCMIGALMPAGIASDTYDAAWHRLYHATGAPQHWGIPDWNDAPGRTKEEVLAAFDRAIAQ